MDIPEDIRIANGVCNRLLRFSVGIEHAEDLKRDVKLPTENLSRRLQTPFAIRMSSGMSMCVCVAGYVIKL
jgi:hypothetical protein